MYSGEVRIDLSSLSVGTYGVEFMAEEDRRNMVYTAQIVRA